MSTIIKHKEFPKFKSWTMDLCGRPLTIEVGKVAELASASAMVKYGDTTVMVAVTVSPRPRDGIDFFPLSVEFEEKLLTALPIIETQAGDVSAYIPTNVISITDGQIFLETELFNSGIRPAVNPGISVSRVGGNAQIKAMKKVAGTLKLAYSQYRELQAFSQFGSDLDADTKKRLNQGERIVEVLKQPQNSPIPVEKQVIIIYAVISGALLDIPADQIGEFEKELFAFVDGVYGDIPETIRATRQMDDDIKEKLTKAIEEFKAKFLSEH